MNNDLYKKMVGIDPQHEGRSSAIDTDDPNELLARTKRYFEAYLGRQRGEATGKKEHLIGTAVAVFGVDVDEARELLQKVLATQGLAEDKLVKIDQPALKDEKPEEDEIAVDANLEPVDFKKDQEDTLTPVTDKDLEVPTQLIDAQQRGYMDAMFNRKQKESRVTEGMHELAVELDNISQEEKALITTAIEKGVIRNEIPSYEDMLNCMIDLHAAEKLGDDEAHEILRTGMLGTADKTQIAADWIKGVILPFIKGELSDHDVGDMYKPPEPTLHPPENKSRSGTSLPDDEKQRESILHICNACCKTFTAVEAKCTHCQSDNVEAIVEEQDDETEAGRLGYTPEQWTLLDHMETMIDDFVTDLDDTYTWDVTQLCSTQDVYEWLEDKQPEIFQSVLRDPDVLSTDAGSEAFFEAMADLGIATRKAEVDHSREDRAEEDRRPFETNESITLKELRDLIPELDLSSDDKILLNQAFEEGFLEDETPPYNTMLQMLIDGGHAERVGLKDAGENLKTGKTAGRAEVTQAFLKDIILPKLRHRYGIGEPELEPEFTEEDNREEEEGLRGENFEMPEAKPRAKELTEPEKMKLKRAADTMKGKLTGLSKEDARTIIKDLTGMDEPVEEKNKDDDEITIPDKPVEEDMDRAHEVDYHDDEVSFDVATTRDKLRLKNHMAKQKHGKDYAACDADEKALVDKEFSESKISEPKEMEDALKKGAQEKGFKPGGERFNRYVYGTLAKRKKAEEATVNEFDDDKNTYASKGHGLEKQAAEEIARREGGHAVVDDEDETKWMVVKKADESKVNETTTWEELGWTDDDLAPDLTDWKLLDKGGVEYEIIGTNEKSITIKQPSGGTKRLDIGDLARIYKCKLMDPQGKVLAFDRTKDFGAPPIEKKISPAEAEKRPRSQQHKCNICLKNVGDPADLNTEDLCRQCAKRQAKESRQLYTKKEARSEFRRYLP